MWLTVSKAFERFKNIPVEYSPLSIAECIFFTKSKIAIAVECFCLKPYWFLFKILNLVK